MHCFVKNNRQSGISENVSELVDLEIDEAGFGRILSCSKRTI
jgi:hypothetical protein